MTGGKKEMANWSNAWKKTWEEEAYAYINQIYKNKLI